MPKNNIRSATMDLSSNWNNYKTIPNLIISGVAFYLELPRTTIDTKDSW